MKAFQITEILSNKAVDTAKLNLRDGDKAMHAVRLSGYDFDVTIAAQLGRNIIGKALNAYTILLPSSVALSLVTAAEDDPADHSKSSILSAHVQDVDVSHLGRVIGTGADARAVTSMDILVRDNEDPMAEATRIFAWYDNGGKPPTSSTKSVGSSRAKDQSAV